jgi:prepilin-type N-terminal cleavage/methylation domain-containing protein/prepilin-type processing-associated H-X9-DG protein
MRKAFSLVELLVVIAIIAVLVALLIPAIQKVRAAAARAECSSKLKQLGLALNGYHDVNGHFPTQAGNQEQGWMYKILPHIDQEALYRQGLIQNRNPIIISPIPPFTTQPIPPPTIQNNPYWDTWSTVVVEFICPSDPRPFDGGDYALGSRSYAMTSYLGVAGRNSWEDWDGPIEKSSPVRVAQITRGLSNTVMVGERPPTPDIFWGWWAFREWDNTLWAVGNINLSPYAWSLTDVVCPDAAFFSEGDLKSECHAAHFWSFHSGGANWLFADGSVQFLTYDAGQTVIPKMASIYGDD